MPSTKGSLYLNAQSELEAEFVIDGHRNTFSAGTYPTHLPQFGSQRATIDYQNPSQLTGNHSYTGHVGSDDVELSFENGPTIRGELNQHGYRHPSNIEGRGVWQRTL